jgi:hypothetical protein
MAIRRHTQYWPTQLGPARASTQCVASNTHGAVELTLRAASNSRIICWVFVRVGYTDDHEPLAYYTNTATEGAYVAAINTDDGSLSLLDVSMFRGIDPIVLQMTPTASTAP